MKSAGTVTPHQVPIDRIRTVQDARDAYLRLTAPRPACQEAGRLACITGTSFVSNPHPVDTTENAAWAYGWNAAEREHR